MGGIEFYPQKEFDEDMEDKSDNDKIRVSSPVLSLTHICPMILSPSHPSFPPSLTQSLSHSRTASSKQNVRALGHVVYLFHLIKNCAALFDTLKCLCPQEAMPFAVVGSDKEYQVNGKRVLGRKTAWGIIEGGRYFLMINIYSLFATEMILMALTYNFFLLQLKIQTIVSLLC